jgi:hypothetical protein
MKSAAAAPNMQASKQSHPMPSCKAAHTHEAAATFRSARRVCPAILAAPPFHMEQLSSGLWYAAGTWQKLLPSMHS